MKIVREKCVSCGACAVYCPMQAIEIKDEGAVIDRDCCVECGVCERVGICPVGAIQKEVLSWPRSIRATFSDPLCIHVETNMAGRGTSEMKTNDVTGRFCRGFAGVALELGRPGLGTRMSEIETITQVLCRNGIVLEKLNPLSKLIDPQTGKLPEELRDEKVMSVVLEFSVKLERLLSVLSEIRIAANDLNTVMSVGVAARADQDGSFDSLRGLLDQAGIFHRDNVKMNLGMGRPLYQEKTPEREGS